MDLIEIKKNLEPNWDFWTKTWTNELF